MPGYIVHFVSTLYQKLSLYAMCQHIALRMWSPVGRSRLYSTEPKILLAHECSRLQLSAQWSRTARRKAENGVFARKKFGQRDVVKSYYGSLAYGDFGKELQVTKKYGKKYKKLVGKPFAGANWG